MDCKKELWTKQNHVFMHNLIQKAEVPVIQIVFNSDHMNTLKWVLCLPALKRLWIKIFMMLDVIKLKPRDAPLLRFHSKYLTNSSSARRKPHKVKRGSSSVSRICGGFIQFHCVSDVTTWLSACHSYRQAYLKLRNQNKKGQLHGILRKSKSKAFGN